MKNSALLQIRDFNLSVANQQTDIALLKEINLDLNRGENLSIIGESGSGKSLLCKAMLGLLPTESRYTGKILFHQDRQWDILKSSERELRYLRRQKLALLFQDTAAALNPLMRCGKQITNSIMEREHESVTKALQKEYIIDLLNRVSLSDPERVYQSYPYQLSGGEKQRVALAIALAGHPQLLIADEPTTALDVITGKKILDELQWLRSQYGFALLLVTHDLSAAFHFAEKIAVMYAGEIVEWGGSQLVANNPAHPYTAALLAIHRSFKENKKPLTLAGDIPAMTDLPSGCPFHPRCKQATTRCRQTKPPVLNLENRIRVRCFHPLEN